MTKLPSIKNRYLPWKRNAAGPVPPGLEALFDAQYYLNQNPDVVDSGMDPFVHFMRYGWREGRDPSDHFALNWYVIKYGLEADQNPLVHFVQVGQAAGYWTAPRTNQEVIDALFDAQYYLHQNPDVAESGMDPFEHFMRYGWREGRDPSALFSLEFYAGEYKLRSGQNPFLHYVQVGRKLGYFPHPDYSDYGLKYLDITKVINAFDPIFYLRHNPDIAVAKINPFSHFMTHGWREGRDPSAEFSVSYYLDENSDISESGENPFVHYILYGQAEGRRPRGHLSAAEELLRAVDFESYDRDEADAIRADFDVDYYLEQYPEVAEMGHDPVAHYLLVGAEFGYNPSADFSTEYYLRTYPEIAAAGHNPFVHYCRWGRKELRQAQSYIEAAKVGFRPLVSVIIPNYNHAAYLRQRLQSIADQSYDNIELIILDDASTDDSISVIRDTLRALDMEARIEVNKVNSGSVFAQWRKGLDLARGDLIWICESDDFCDPDFLVHLVPAFADQSVNIAFGRIQFADKDGVFMPGLDTYREGAEPGIWDSNLTRPAACWFNRGFGVNNLYANVGGGIFRKPDLSDAIWDTAQSFKICGDWFLYIHIAGAGQISYASEAVAYFRQHGSNTSASNFHQRYYYDENIRILRLLISRWGLPLETRRAFLSKVKAQYDAIDDADKWGQFDTVFDTTALMQESRTEPHIQLYFLGFHPGGGELFPINLANALTQAGRIVSMVAVDMSDINEDMRGRLNSQVPVYHIDHLIEASRGVFLHAAGVSVINSHIANSDGFLAQIDEAPIEVPYVVTLHGSYVGLENADDQVITWITDNVHAWVYTADRNLEFFENRPVDHTLFTKLPNAMPPDPRPAPFSRADLGIAASDTVFMLVARGVKRKGWRAAVEAFKTLRATREDIHLLLIGEGPATEDARHRAGDQAGVHFLGYQSQINGILRLTDCMLLPTRFEGESYPLCLIQALQEQVPVIATDIGEIRSMMTANDKAAGLILENQRDSTAYLAALTEAMEKICDPGQRAKFSVVAKTCGAKFDMARLVEDYVRIYQQAQQRFETTTLAR